MVEPDVGEKNIFWGQETSEIPLVLRFLFLVGMIYPYLSMTPIICGLLQCLILTVAWLIGYMSTSHASVWCLANCAQCISMILDPYIFPPQDLSSKTSKFDQSDVQVSNIKKNK